MAVKIETFLGDWIGFETNRVQMPIFMQLKKTIYFSFHVRFCEFHFRRNGNLLGNKKVLIDERRKREGGGEEKDK